MNKYIVIVAVVAVVGTVGVLNIYDADPRQSENTAMFDPTPQAETNRSNTSAGEYIEYSEEKVASFPGKTKIVFFHADWCPNCKALERNILAGAIPEDIVILKADYDKDTALRQKYGVTSQTTLVQIDDSGKKVKLWIGSAFDDIEDIQEETI